MDGKSVHAKRGVWSAARDLAERTPASRNRYVDFLRAVSILAVVVGHWLIAAPAYRDGALVLGHMLDISPWTRWLTWGFQVMPVFFIDGVRRSGAGRDRQATGLAYSPVASFIAMTTSSRAITASSRFSATLSLHVSEQKCIE